MFGDNIDEYMEEYNLMPPARKNEGSTPYAKSLILTIMADNDEYIPEEVQEYEEIMYSLDMYNYRNECKRRRNAVIMDRFYYSLMALGAVITIMVIIMMFTGPNLVLASCVGIGTIVGLALAITYCAVYSRKN